MTILHALLRVDIPSNNDELSTEKVVDRFRSKSMLSSMLKTNDVRCHYIDVQVCMCVFFIGYVYKGFVYFSMLLDVPAR